MAIIKPVILFLLASACAISTYAQAKPAAKNARDTVFPKVDSLKAAIVTATLRPKIKGDTVEYNTENAVMQPNAVVEELLRRLPGLRIDPDGTITYNGEKVQHLLVNGEDIFGSDPTMVTRTFDASKIARVQVLDRKTDQALFTGIDDGVRNKTLNLVLKESAKDGFFGKIEAGANMQGTYAANGLAAAFTGDEQFTALGLATNTGLKGFGGGGQSLTVLSTPSDALGASAGAGVPQAAATGLHYANTWDQKADHVIGNYQFGHLSTNPLTTTITQQTLPDTIYLQSQKASSTNTSDQHLFSGTYDLAADAQNAFKFSFYGQDVKGHNQYSDTASSTFNDTLVNNSFRKMQSDVHNQNLGGALSWRTKCQKDNDRNFSIFVAGGRNENATNGYLYSINRFYQAGGLPQSTDTVDQRKAFTTNAVIASGTLGYTQPLWKNVVLAATAGISLNSTESQQYSYGNAGGKYDAFIDSLSTHLKGRTINENSDVNLQGKGRKLTYTAGGTFLSYNYRQQDIMTDSVLHLHYFTFSPHIFGNYVVDKHSHISFSYVGSVQEPSPAQLAPVKNNSDPLSIVIGNPDLKPSSAQNFRVWYQSVRTFIVNLTLTGGFVSNSISTKTTTDSLGRQVSQAANAGGAMNGGINFMLNRRLGASGIDAGLVSNLNFNRSVNYVNTTLSRNDTYTPSGGLTLSKYEPEKYSFRVDASAGYFYTRSSINPAAPTHYWTQTYNAQTSIFPFKGFEINTAANYNWQEKTGSFGKDISILLWNGYLSQNLLKNQLVLRLSVNNLLNQNAGLSRSNVVNVNTETSTNVMGRYWLLTAVYHFDKKFRKKN